MAHEFNILETPPVTLADGAGFVQYNGWDVAGTAGVYRMNTGSGNHWINSSFGGRLAKLVADAKEQWAKWAEFTAKYRSDEQEPERSLWLNLRRDGYAGNDRNGSDGYVRLDTLTDEELAEVSLLVHETWKRGRRS
jgi:hypothetical protein